MTRGRVEALDGLRAVAILGVIATHLGWLPGGHLGVVVFFTLSGFLITNLLLEERRNTGRIALGAFYLRRARRLMPALAVVLAVSSLWLLAQHPEHAWRMVAVGAGTAIGYVSNFATAAGAVTGDTYGWAWSLSIEEQFYLLWAPLVLVLASRRRWLVLIALVLSGVAVIERVVWAHPDSVTPMALYVRTDARADAVLIGCLAALAWQRGWLRRLAVLSPAAIVVLSFAYVKAATTYRSTYTIWMLLTELATVVLISAAMQPNVVAEFLASRPLVHIGRISYSLYLWDVLTRDMAARWLHQDPWHLSPLGVVLSLSLLGFAAECSWAYVEKRWTRRRSVSQVLDRKNAGVGGVGEHGAPVAGGPHVGPVVQAQRHVAAADVT